MIFLSINRDCTDYGTNSFNIKYDCQRFIYWMNLASCMNRVFSGFGLFNSY